MTYSKTSLANRALDLVGKATVLDITTATGADAKNVNRHFEPVFKRCLRRYDWPFALKRMQLNPDASAPVNEFAYKFALPANYVRLADIWPKLYGSPLPYKIEEGYILCDENDITIKYVSSAVLSDLSSLDPNFAEYFAHELAVALTYKMTDSVALRKDLRDTARELYAEATALLSQEGTDDPVPESPWITDRYGGSSNIHDEISIEGLE